MKLRLIILILFSSLIFNCLCVYANTDNNCDNLKYEYITVLAKAMGIDENNINDYNVNHYYEDENQVLIPAANQFLVASEIKYFSKYLDVINSEDDSLAKNIKYNNDIYYIIKSEMIMTNVDYSADEYDKKSVEYGFVPKIDNTILEFNYDNINKYIQCFLNKNVYYYFDINGNLQINKKANYTYADLYCDRHNIVDRNILNYDYLSNYSKNYATRADAITTIAKSMGVNDNIVAKLNDMVVNDSGGSDMYLMGNDKGYARALFNSVVFGTSKDYKSRIMPLRKVTANEVYTFMLRALVPVDYNTRDGAIYYNLLNKDDRWCDNLNQIITKDELKTINDRFLNNKVYNYYIEITDDEQIDVCDYVICDKDLIYRDLVSKK